MNLRQQIEAVLPLVSKPTRYLGNEFHVVRKEPTRDMVQWCLILPEVYEIGMSHWGLRILYDILNRRPDTLAERAYAPWFDMEAQLRRFGIPLFSLETRRPVGDFDLVGFSLQYELTYSNILNCLDLAGIPLRSEDRRDGDPLVLAGGPCVSNPEPMSDFIDIFLIGDGEEAVPAITEAYRGLRGRPRREILLEMSKLPGLYVPLMYESTYGPDGRLQGTRPRHAGVPPRVQRQFIKDLETAPYPEAPLVPLQGIVQDRLSVEVLRGCTQGCRFCQAGYLYRPIRERSVEKILEIADKGIRTSGWDEVGLVSLSTADYTQLEPLADVLNARFGSDQVAISLPSLRADSFGVGIADRVKETRRTGFTFAPEAGSERLRLAMNKIIRDEEFFSAARVAYERGWRLIKMYFMVGLPTETWEDIEGIVNFVDTVRRIGRECGTSCTVNASVGAFVPKSHTPFQWDAFEDVALLKEKIGYLRRTVSTRWSRLKWHPVDVSHLEAVFSNGDRRLGPAIESAFRRGARFDGWTEHFNYKLWLECFEENGVDPAFHTRARGFEEPLPWDHIDIGVLKKWLVRERKKTDAQDFTIGKSLVADCRHGDCTACGIPGLPYDTQLTPKLEESDFRRLMDQAREGAPATKPAARTENETTWPVRIRFEKSGSARFLSHLETAGAFARAFRMSRVRLAHSQGHSPHPRLSFGPPLPVGFFGLREGLDAELYEPWTDAARESLNAVLPEGLRILDGIPLPAHDGTRRTSLMAAAERAIYSLDFSLVSAEPRERAAERLRDFQTRESWVVERTYWTPAASREVQDWEGPLDPNAAAPESGLPETGGSSEPSVPSEPRSPRRDERPRGRSKGKGKDRDRAPRMVDLKHAIHRLDFDANFGKECALEIELYLQHPDGHVANPRVVLEKLLLLSPEEGARVGIVRTTLLSKEGTPVL